MALYEVLEDGTIVPKGGSSNIYVKTDLEKEITITSGQSSIFIDNLFLGANEVYDIYLLCASSSASDMYLKINEISSGYKYIIKQGYWYEGSSANMNTSGSTNDSKFKVGTSWTVTNSFHINLCNIGDYIAIESQETSLDSTTNYIRDCSGAVSFSGDVTRLTFSLASGTFTGGRLLVYKRSKNKKPAIVYTGKELFAGNGISINNGVVSAEHPIGSYHICKTGSSNPASLFGGTWKQIRTNVALPMGGTAKVITSASDNLIKSTTPLHFRKSDGSDTNASPSGGSYLGLNYNNMYVQQANSGNNKGSVYPVNLIADFTTASSVLYVDIWEREA